MEIRSLSVQCKPYSIKLSIGAQSPNSSRGVRLSWLLTPMHTSTLQNQSHGLTLKNDGG